MLYKVSKVEYVEVCIQQSMESISMFYDEHKLKL